jgi:hypothetical protein
MKQLFSFGFGFPSSFIGGVETVLIKHLINWHIKGLRCYKYPFFLFFLLLFYFPFLISRFSLTPSHRPHLYFSFLLFSSFILFSFFYLVSLLRTTNRIVLRSVTFQILAFRLFKSQTAFISQKFKNSL